MPTFTYKARRPNAGMLTDLIEAADQNEAISRLRRMGLFVLSIEPARGSATLVGGSARRRIAREDLAVLTSQLASLLRAGLPLVAAIASLQQQAKGTALADVLEKVNRALSESHSFSESLAKFPQVFPKTYVAAVRAGEEGGMLAEVLGRLAISLKKEMEIRGRIRGALAYPVFLCLFGGVTLAVLMLFVIPRFTKLFATMGEQLPLPTKILLGFSDVMDQFWPVVLAGLVAVVAGSALVARQESVRVIIDRCCLMLPYVGQIIRRSEIARFSRTLGELLTSGVPILNALAITRGVMTNHTFGNTIDDIRQGVSKGTPIAAMLAKHDVFTPLVVNMTSVGEQSGQLPDLLMEVADIYEKECERAIQAFTTILGPALIVVLGGVIAFVITAILLPVFQAGTLVD